MAKQIQPSHKYVNALRMASISLEGLRLREQLLQKEIEKITEQILREAGEHDMAAELHVDANTWTFSVNSPGGEDEKPD